MILKAFELRADQNILTLNDEDHPINQEENSMVSSSLIIAKIIAYQTSDSSEKIERMLLCSEFIDQAWKLIDSSYLISPETKSKKVSDATKKLSHEVTKLLSIDFLS